MIRKALTETAKAATILYVLVAVADYRRRQEIRMLALQAAMTFRYDILRGQVDAMRNDRRRR